jgi:hypothetical protein
MKEETKSRAEHLSTVLREAGTLDKVDRIAAEAGILAPLQAGPTAESSHPAQPRTIGIWERKQENGETWYVRTPQRESCGFWSNLERIGPKDSRKRILLLGESVARGTCYDPFFTPAMALDRILSCILSEPLEVIDLARTDIGLYELRGLIESSLALSPDAMVIFAGNNWRLPKGTVNFDLAELASKVERAGDWAPITAWVREEVRSGVRTLLALLHRIITERRIPVVFLLPEFNLLDWKNELCGQAPTASGADLVAWEDWRKQAEESLAKGNIDRATELAQRMVTVDRGTLPVGYEILARCKLKLGEVGPARRFYELARDSSHSLPINLPPRCYSIIQELLRQEAPGCGVRLVDLPDLFASFRGDQRPGRELFLDYCHMNSEGIRLAMAAAAKELSVGLGDSKASDEEAFSVSIAVDKTTEAHAHFLAAIHNARCGQEYDIVRYHCDVALEHDAAIAETMLLYLQASFEPAPLFMSKSLWHMPERSRQAMSWSLRSFNRERDINLVMLDAIVDALGSAVPDLSTHVGRVLNREFGVKGGSINLLAKPFCSPASYQPERDWESRRINFLAFSRRSSFWFVSDGNGGMQVSLTYRVPHATPESGQVRVFANDQLVHVCPALSNWRDTVFLLAPELGNKRRVRLVIEWPDPAWTKEQRLAELVSHLRQGPLADALMGFPDSFATFGEIQLLTASEHVEGAIRPCKVRSNDPVMIESQA